METSASSQNVLQTPKSAFQWLLPFSLGTRDDTKTQCPPAAPKTSHIVWMVTYVCCSWPSEKIWWLANDTWPTKVVGASLIAILQYQYWVTILVSVAPGYPSYLLPIYRKPCFFVGGVAPSDSFICRNSGGLFSQRNLLSLDLKHGGSPESCLTATYFEYTCTHTVSLSCLCQAFESVTSICFCCLAEELEPMVEYSLVPRPRKRAWYLLHVHAPTTPRKPRVPQTTVRFFALLLLPRVWGYTDMTSLRTLGAGGRRKNVQSFAAPQIFLG